MGTINDKLDKLNQTKTNIKNELRRKGADVKDSDTFASYEGYLHDLEIVNAQAKTVNPSTSSQTVLPDSEHNALSQVTVNPVTSSIDNNIQSYNIKAGVSILGIEGNVEPDKPDQNKTVNPSTSIQEVTADIGYELAKVTVNAIETETKNVKSTTTSQTVTPTAGKFINEITVEPIELEQITVTPSITQQIITPSQNKDGISQVTVSPVTSAIDQNIQSNNIKAGITILNTSGKSSVVDTEDADATANNILENKTAYVNGNKVTGSMTDLGQLNITPTTTAQTIPAGYTSGGTVNAVPDETSVLNAQDTLLATQEIKISDLEEALNNKIALDLTSATSDANATASDIKQGKSAYVNGQKINGTIPQFTNDITSLTSMIEYEIRSFYNYLETHFEQNAPYLNEPITIYAPDENMKYFIIEVATNSQFRILWSKFKFAGLKHSSNTQNDINLIRELSYTDTPVQFVIDEFTFNSPNYASGYSTHLANKTDTYYSNYFSTLEDLISAISNPNSSITYSHPTNASSYGAKPNIELITNMYVWDNNISSTSTALREWVTTQKLSNNVTILPLE